jgi:hypothetical protein
MLSHEVEIDASALVGNVFDLCQLSFSQGVFVSIEQALRFVGNRLKVCYYDEQHQDHVDLTHESATRRLVSATLLIEVKFHLVPEYVASLNHLPKG